jgi:hypothetical protein
MLNKGFIGPVGDDMPSLTPLIFGLLMFFGAFTTAFTSFNQRNSDFSSDIEVLKISKQLESNGYIYSYENFQDLCNQINSTNIKFMAAITSEAFERSNKSTIFEIVFYGTPNKFYCTNFESATPNPEQFKDIIDIPNLSQKKVVSRVIPIVVEDNKIAKPMHLMVIAWK